MQYQPYYAYEEVLAVFKDLRRQTKTLLADLESVTRTILGSNIELGPLAEDKQAAILAQFVGERQAGSGGTAAAPGASGYLLTTPGMKKRRLTSLSHSFRTSWVRG